MEYVEAGGSIMRDLFQADDGGWLDDLGLLDRLVGEKLARDADAVRGEGWKWVEVSTEFPYGHVYGMRLIASERRLLTDEEIASVEALRAESEEIEERYADADEIPEEIDHRLQEIEAAVAAINERPAIYDPTDIMRSGAFVSIDGSGRLRVQRGYVRPEDEAPAEEPGSMDGKGDGQDRDRFGNGVEALNEETDNGRDSSANGAGGSPTEATEEDEGIRPLSDKLLTELTAFRTLALREAIGNDPGIAFLALLHALVLRLFYRYGSDSCLEIEPKSIMFGNQAPGLADTPLAARVDARHESWAQQLPEEPDNLWEVLQTFDSDSRDALFAHCVSLTINAVHEAWNRRPKALAHANTLAEAVSLDMVGAGWVPTADNYLGRVSKARILEAVRGKG